MGVPPLLVVGSDLDQKARGHNNPELLAEYSSPAKSSHEVAIYGLAMAVGTSSG
jgi:hypothetical protein